MKELKKEIERLLKKRKEATNYYYIDDFEIYLIDKEIEKIEQQINKLLNKEMKGIE